MARHDRQVWVIARTWAQRGRLTAPWASHRLIIPIAGIAAVLFAIYLARWVIAQDQGTQAMQDVAATIYEGAVAFIRRQYVTIGVLALVASVIVGAVIAIVNTPEVSDTDHQRRPAGHLHRDRLPGRAPPAPWRRASSACSSASRPTCAPPRRRATAWSARYQVAMRGGAVSGFLVVALSLLGVYGIFVAFGGFDQPCRGAVPHRRLRLRRLVRGAVRPARRRYLHQGRRRRLGPRRQGRGGHPRGRPAQRGRHRGPRRRQRRRLRRSWRRPVRVHRRREHRGHDPGRRGLLHRPGRRLAQSRGVDLLPARGPRLRPHRHHRLGRLLHQGQGRRGSDEDPQPRLLGDDDLRGHRPGHRDLLHDGHRLPDGRQRHPDLGLVLPRGLRRPRHQHRVRVHHPVLHRRRLAPGQGDRRGVQDGPRDEHHLGRLGGHGDDPRHRRHHRHRAAGQPLAGRAGGHRQRGRA